MSYEAWCRTYGLAVRPWPPFAMASVLASFAVRFLRCRDAVLSDHLLHFL